MPGREQDFASLFAQALDYIATLGGRAIHCMTGTVNPEQRAAAEKTFTENLLRASDRAAEKDITLLIEPINLRNRADYFLTRAEQAAEMQAKLDRPNVRLQFDFYHQQIMGGDLITRFEKHLPFIGHVQVAGVPARAEPDDGEVNYPAIFAAVDRLGYTGWIVASIGRAARPKMALAGLASSDQAPPETSTPTSKWTRLSGTAVRSHRMRNFAPMLPVSKDP